jgi:hypothetical protein
MNDGNAFFIIVLLLVCFMGYMNTGSETNLKHYEALSEYNSNTEIFEESGINLHITQRSIVEVTLTFDKCIEQVNNSRRPQLLEASIDSRGSPKRA